MGQVAAGLGAPGRDRGRRRDRRRARSRPARLLDPDHACRSPTRRRSSRCCGAASRRSTGPRNEDICYATTNRQTAVAAIAPRADLFLVVGAANSSNSRAAGRGGPPGRRRPGRADPNAPPTSTGPGSPGSATLGALRRRLGARDPGRGADRRLPRASRGRRSRRSASPRRDVTFRSPPIPLLAGPPEPVAVYTDVAADELRGLPRRLRARARLVACEGIAEGVENSNFRLETERGPLHPDHLREAGRPRRPAVLPGLMEHLAAHGLPCPLPVHARDGRALRRLADKPAAIVSFLDGQLAAADRRPGIAPPLGEALAACTWPAPDFRLTRANALSFAGWQLLFDGCRGRRRPGRARARRRRSRPSSPASRAHWPHGSAGGRDPRRPVPGQRLLRGRARHRHHRLLLRLQRPARLRRRDLPERLVLRARPLLQHHQGAGPAAAATARRRAAVARPRSRRCRCWRAARRCASC